MFFPFNPIQLLWSTGVNEVEDENSKARKELPTDLSMKHYPAVIMLHQYQYGVILMLCAHWVLRIIPYGQTPTCSQMYTYQKWN